MEIQLQSLKWSKILSNISQGSSFESEGTWKSNVPKYQVWWCGLFLKLETMHNQFQTWLKIMLEDAHQGRMLLSRLTGHNECVKVEVSQPQLHPFDNFA